MSIRTWTPGLAPDQASVFTVPFESRSWLSSPPSFRLPGSSSFSLPSPTLMDELQLHPYTDASIPSPSCRPLSRATHTYPCTANPATACISVSLPITLLTCLAPWHCSTTTDVYHSLPRSIPIMEPPPCICIPYTRTYVLACTLFAPEA